MCDFLIPFIKENKKRLFQPKLLTEILNQEFNFFDYALEEKLSSTYKVKEGIALKWERDDFSDGSRAFRPIISEKGSPWGPAHFIAPRTKTLKYQNDVDEDVLTLIQKRAILVIGTVK